MCSCVDYDVLVSKCFKMDDNFVAVGSADGSGSVWSLKMGKIEALHGTGTMVQFWFFLEQI